MYSSYSKNRFLASPLKFTMKLSQSYHRLYQLLRMIITVYIVYYYYHHRNYTLYFKYNIWSKKQTRFFHIPFLITWKVYQHIVRMQLAQVTNCKIVTTLKYRSNEEKNHSFMGICNTVFHLHRDSYVP